MKRKKSQFASEYDRFMALSDAEKEADVARYDKEFVFEESRPLTPPEQREWNKIKRGPGRPKKGGGASVISLSVERNLLKLADSFAETHQLSRSEMFSRGIKAILAANGAA